MAVKLAKKPPRETPKPRAALPPLIVVAEAAVGAKKIPLVVKATRYSLALARWWWAGRPTRTQREIDTLLKLCQDCPRIVGRPPKQFCGECGCSVSKADAKWKNKLAMRSESCPIGKW